MLKYITKAYMMSVASQLDGEGGGQVNYDPVDLNSDIVDTNNNGTIIDEMYADLIDHGAIDGSDEKAIAALIAYKEGIASTEKSTTEILDATFGKIDTQIRSQLEGGGLVIHDLKQGVKLLKGLYGQSMNTLPFESTNIEAIKGDLIFQSLGEKPATDPIYDKMIKAGVVNENRTEIDVAGAKGLFDVVVKVGEKNSLSTELVIKGENKLSDIGIKGEISEEIQSDLSEGDKTSKLDIGGMDDYEFHDLNADAQEILRSIAKVLGNDVTEKGVWDIIEGEADKRFDSSWLSWLGGRDNASTYNVLFGKLGVDDGQKPILRELLDALGAVITKKPGDVTNGESIKAKSAIEQAQAYLEHQPKKIEDEWPSTFTAQPGSVLAKVIANYSEELSVNDISILKKFAYDGVKVNGRWGEKEVKEFVAVVQKALDITDGETGTLDDNTKNAIAAFQNEQDGVDFDGGFPGKQVATKILELRAEADVATEVVSAPDAGVAATVAEDGKVVEIDPLKAEYSVEQLIAINNIASKGRMGKKDWGTPEYGLALTALQQHGKLKECIDGKLCPATREYIGEFEREHGLAVDPVGKELAGPQVFAKFQELLEAEGYSFA